MNEPVVTMDVRQVAPDVAIIDITGEVTAACEGASPRRTRTRQRPTRGVSC